MQRHGIPITRIKSIHWRDFKKNSPELFTVNFTILMNATKCDWSDWNCCRWWMEDTCLANFIYINTDAAQTSWELVMTFSSTRGESHETINLSVCLQLPRTSTIITPAVHGSSSCKCQQQYWFECAKFLCLRLMSLNRIKISPSFRKLLNYQCPQHDIINWSVTKPTVVPSTPSFHIVIHTASFLSQICWYCEWYHIIVRDSRIILVEESLNAQIYFNRC